MHFQLTTEIINLSVSDHWATAKSEWVFEYAYQSEEAQTCLCGHSPIYNICVIRNTQNEKETEVGNCCVKKFMGIENGNKIFDSVKRLKDDLSKSMSAEVLEYLKDKQAITIFEYNFYIDTLRKRNFTQKQLDIRKRVNQKLLDFTSYERNSVVSRINMVLKWAEKNTRFDTKFIYSLKQTCERKGKLSDNQSKALENIIRQYKIK